MSVVMSSMPINEENVDDSIVTLTDEGFTLLAYVVNKINV